MLGLLLVKALVLWGIARATGIAPGERPLFIVLLAQGGEMGFVIFQAASGARVMDASTASLLTAAVTLSMLVAPLLLIGADRTAARHAAAPARKLDEIAEEQHAPVIIAGFGRYGQIVGRLLSANGLEATVLDHDVEQIETVRRFGWKAFYGDATRLDLLRVSGAGRARVLVLAIDDVEQSVEVAKLVREHFPGLTIVARARNVGHYYRLSALGVTLIERETLDAALMSGRSVLELMGWERHAARTQALRFRRHSIELMQRMAPHSGDEKRLIALAKEGRQQLEAQWAQERAQNQRRQGRGDWQSPQPGTDRAASDE